LSKEALVAALLVPALLTAACLAGEGGQQQAVETDLRSTLQSLFDEFHSQGNFPGATAGFALADGSSFGIATGKSDKSTDRAMDPGALMIQGSVGKTYVSALALQLVQEGKIGLDDPISRWFGEEEWFPRLPNAGEITVRMLMNHTSGLVRYEFRDEFTRELTSNPDKVWKPLELVSYILDTEPPFRAGKGWTYSDTNYIVVGMIIEKVTGSTYYDQLRKRVLEPLGLRHTLPTDGPVIAGLSQGYAGDDNPFGGKDAMIEDGRFVFNPQFEWCGGGIASTTEDLARWGKLLYEGHAFDASLMKELLAGVPARLGPETQYGLGVIIRPTPLGMAYGHSGFFPGYLTEMMYFPEHKFSVAVQVNTSVPRSTGKPLRNFVIDFAGAIVQ
jgi:D-alanyl-D-alanine carboxypeptidase